MPVKKFTRIVRGSNCGRAIWETRRCCKAPGYGWQDGNEKLDFINIGHMMSDPLAYLLRFPYDRNGWDYMLLYVYSMEKYRKSFLWSSTSDSSIKEHLTSIPSFVVENLSRIPMSMECHAWSGIRLKICSFTISFQVQRRGIDWLYRERTAWLVLTTSLYLI